MEVEVAYTGAAEEDLIVTLFDVWPAVAPPQHFAFVPGGGFPAVATIEGVAEGTWTLVAVLDAEPKSSQSGTGRSPWFDRDHRTLGRACIGRDLG